MLSTESQNQSQPSSVYDERIFNERIRQLFNSIDSAGISSSNNNVTQMTSIVDALFPEQASLYQQQEQQQQQYDQRRSSTNDLTTTFDRFSLWNTSNCATNNSVSSFCGETTNASSSSFANRRQNKLQSSTRSLRNNYYPQQQQQQPQNQYRPPPLTRSRFTSSIRLPSAATITAPSSACTNGLQRSSSTLSTNNTTSGTDYQPRFASRLSTTRLPSAAPAGSHDQIVGNHNKVDSKAPTSSTDVTDQSCSTSAVLSRNASSTSMQPQKFVTMTQTTTTTFCYVPASGSLVYNNLAGTGRSTAVTHH